MKTTAQEYADILRWHLEQYNKTCLDNLLRETESSRLFIFNETLHLFIEINKFIRKHYGPDKIRTLWESIPRQRQ